MCLSRVLWSSVVEAMPGMQEALDSFPGTTKRVDGLG